MDMVLNTIALNKELVDEFKDYQKGVRGNTVSMAKKAFGIRSQYLSAAFDFRGNVFLFGSFHKNRF
jgi:hypothetical protein